MRKNVHTEVIHPQIQVHFITGSNRFIKSSQNGVNSSKKLFFSTLNQNHRNKKKKINELFYTPLFSKMNGTVFS